MAIDARKADSRSVIGPVRIKFRTHIAMESFNAEESVGPKAAHGVVWSMPDASTAPISET